MQFKSMLLLHIGLDDEMAMGTVEILHEDLAEWREKPWTKKSKKVNSRRENSLACKHPSRLLRSDSALKACSTNKTEIQTGSPVDGHFWSSSCVCLSVAMSVIMAKPKLIKRKALVLCRQVGQPELLSRMRLLITNMQ